MQTSEGALILSPKDSRRDRVAHSTIEMNVVGQVLFLSDRTQIPLSPPLFFYQFSFFSVFPPSTETKEHTTIFSL